MLRRSQERKAGLMVGRARLVLDVRCRTERGKEEKREEEVEAGGRGGLLTSFVGAVVAGVGVGVVEEEGAEDGPAEDEVGVVCVAGFGWSQWLVSENGGGHCGWERDFTGWRGRAWR